MRNALVLVPLCIGLTSGFIVTTSTSEVRKLPKNMSTSKKEATISLQQYKSKNYSINSTNTEVLHSYNNFEDEIKKELYNQGQADKNIDERSFVFVNQRWKKVPSKTHLVDTMPWNPYSNKSSGLSVFEQTPIDPDKKVVAITGNTKAIHSDKQQNVQKSNKSTNKNIFPALYQLEDRIHPNRDIHSKYSKENEILPYKYTIDGGNSADLSEIQSMVDNTINDYIKISKQTNDDRDYFKEVSKVNNVATVDNKYRDNIVDKFKKKYTDDLYKDDTSELKEKVYWAYKLFQNTGEDQILDKHLLQRYKESKLSNYKYCEECSKLANLRKLDNRLDMECKCKCGRYIHIKSQGSSKLKDEQNTV